MKWTSEWRLLTCIVILLLYTLIKTTDSCGCPQIGQPQLSFSGHEQLKDGVVQGGENH